MSMEKIIAVLFFAFIFAVMIAVAIDSHQRREIYGKCLENNDVTDCETIR